MAKKINLKREYEKGFKAGYNKCLDDHDILYGKDAERLLDEVYNPKPMTKKQKKFLDDCIKVYESTRGEK